MEKNKILEFIHSLRDVKEWTSEEEEIINLLLQNVEQSETNGHLKDAILTAIRMLPQIVDWLNDLLE